MSGFARTPPESHAAWQQIKRNVALDPDEQLRARREEKSRELNLLYAELQESPTSERIQRYCELMGERTRLAEQSFVRSVERRRCEDMRIAELQAGIENYRRLFDEHLRLVDFVHQQQVLALQSQAEIERRQRLYAENVILNAAREIQNLRDREQGSANLQASRPGNYGHPDRSNII